MSTQLPIVLVAALAAGGVGAVAVNALRPAPEPAAKSAPAALDPSGELSTQVAALAATNERILERLDSLENRAILSSGGTSRTPVAGSGVDVEALIEERLAALGTTPSGKVVTPEFRNMVDAVLEQRAEEQRLEREQERILREQQQLEDRLAKLQTDLGLDPNQVDGMRKVFQESNVRRDEMRDAMREARDAGGGNVDFQTMRDAWSGLQEETNAALQGILTPTQYEQYQETSNNDRPMGGRGNRGGFNGGAQGGGNTGGGGGRGR